MRSIVPLLTAAIVGAAASSALAQGIPTTQPKFLHIFREQVKVGRQAEHSKYEAAWPVAFERTKNPYNYIALESVTGPPEVWYVTTLANQAAYGDMLARESDPTLQAELDHLAKGDGEFLSEQNAIQAVAMPELSHGDFPDIGLMRFWEITTFRVKPGHREDFIAGGKAYAAAAARVAPGASWRTYEVVAGAPGDTYVIFSSVASFAEFDKAQADSEAIWKGMNDQERGALQKAMTDGILSTMTNRYRLDPRQSYVSKEIRAKDPAFWTPRTTVARASAPAAKATAASPKASIDGKPRPVAAEAKTPGQR